MDANLKIFVNPLERWPALVLATVVTVLLFAAINTGFAAPAGYFI